MQNIFGYLLYEVIAMKKIRKNTMVLLTLLLMLAAFSNFSIYAFQTYEGPEKPKNEVAYLKSLNNNLLLLRVDDIHRYNWVDGLNRADGKMFNFKFEVGLLPGEHEFELEIAGSLKRFPFVIHFNAEAGKTYLMDLKKDILTIYVDRVDDEHKIQFEKHNTTLYEEPTGSDTATIRIQQGFELFKVKLTAYIYRIDKMSPKTGYRSFNGGSQVYDLRMSPGRHTLVYSVYGSNYNTEYYTKTFEESVDVEAGKTYRFEFVKQETGNGIYALGGLKEIAP